MRVIYAFVVCRPWYRRPVCLRAILIFRPQLCVKIKFPFRVFPLLAISRAPLLMPDAKTSQRIELKRIV